MNTDLLELFNLRVLCVDWRMCLLPSSFEAFELLAVDLSAIVCFIVFFNFGNSFKLLDDLLVVTSALSSSPIMKILLEGFEDLRGSK